MNRSNLFLVVVLSFGFSAHAQTKNAPVAKISAPTLEEIYVKTLERSESNEVQKLLVEQADNSVWRLQTKLFPTIDSAANYTQQGRDVGGDTIRTENSSAIRVGIRQPLYRGGALTSAYDIAKIDRTRAQVTEEQTRWTIWWMVTDLYYLVLRNESSLKNYRELEDVLNRRQAEISRRARLGRSRAADYQSTVSQRFSVLAMIQGLQTATDVARLRLTQMSGLTLSSALSRPSVPPVVVADRPTPELRPDLKLRSLNVDRAKSEVDFSTAGLFPALDLVGNYYPYRADSATSAITAVKWDAGLQLTWTLDFEELSFAGKKDRQLNQNIEEVRSREALRLSQEEFERKLRTQMGLQKQSEDLKSAVEAADKASKSLQGDFRGGTIGLLEVVAQENSYWDLKRQYDNLVLDRDLIAWELLWLQGHVGNAAVTGVTR